MPAESYPQPPAPRAPLERIDAADAFVRATVAVVEHGGDKAFYSPPRDMIQMPPLNRFDDKETYYGTLLHELTHWTRHKSRLDRDFEQKRFGDQGYATEELVAELGAAFLCAELGITPDTREDHASYIHEWLTVLKEDNRAIFRAASHAQRAADYLKGLQSQLPVPVPLAVEQSAPAPEEKQQPAPMPTKRPRRQKSKTAKSSSPAPQ